MNLYFSFLSTLSLLVLFSGCTSKQKDTTLLNTEIVSASNTVKKRELSQDFNEYWYAGNAEITSYKLSQERYGELREGNAVTIFVTEDFVPKKQVKADSPSEENIPVLKLNRTKKFLTGIYPYSIMTSTFSPVASTENALKVTNSVQEWCGQVFMQLNNKSEYEINSYSYFESEGDQSLQLKKDWLEDEIWSLIRIHPEELPTGDIMMIPSFESIRLRHKEIKAYTAFANLKQGDSISSYSLNYPNLQRELKIYFQSEFPYQIEKWEEINGANNTESLKTTATRLKTIKTAYWRQNNNKDVVLRDSLGL
ncbi:septum formation inhibitor Maf [Patiriisocius hiemis]|uniref:Septum formation inhibitor Maf n=1 Tax=Patiriisocius hiemis TaxID=3075604 RepID=A0ABU2Y9Z1_9FLAO|nr:septum formation inhibitor Maf [Constantimarinum sp. W242]MDT0555007.1 septum formation inhibitor Maf [Constantimarinum sp. W242]